MKKLLLVLLSLALLSALTLTAFAATLNKTTTSDTKDVTATYNPGGTLTVYSVDIAWGSMSFEYTDASAGTWDPATHTYSGSTPAAWASTTNTITVTNHSNAGVSVKLDYTPAADYTGITGTFQNAAEETVTALNLATAEGTTPATAPGATATLNLSGELPESASSVTVGSVTVTLNN